MHFKQVRIPAGGAGRSTGRCSRMGAGFGPGASSLWGIPVSALTKHHIAIVPRSERFSHDDACRVCRDALKKDPDHSTVVIDLRHAREVTTAAFARLVLLRRRLRADGRDLRLTNLHERAESLYEVNRLSAVLPRT